MRSIKNIYEVIESELRVRGISVTEFSEKMGHNTSWFSVCKNRETELRLTDIQKISDTLNLSIDYMLCGDEYISRTPETEMIPLVNQKVSAGYGETVLESDVAETFIQVPEIMLKGFNRSSIRAARVKGDSMNDVKIYSGDIVLFADHLVEGDGIYVINYFNDLYVKRLQFDPFHNKVSIISENRSYKTIECDADNENLVIQGKVISWIHKEV